MHELKVAAIGRTGRGDWGHQIDELWTGLPGVTLVAVADEAEEGLAKAVARHELPAAAGFRDWRKMLATVRPDIVALCMRDLDCRAEMAIAAAAAGVKGIFMEKPFVPTRAAADAVIKACTQSNTKLALAFVNRHAPAYSAVRDLIEAGRIGKVLELRGRGKEDQRGGGQDLWVLGCHVLDMMADLGGAGSSSRTSGSRSWALPAPSTSVPITCPTRISARRRCGGWTRSFRGGRSAPRGSACRPRRSRPSSGRPSAWRGAAARPRI